MRFFCLLFCLLSNLFADIRERYFDIIRELSLDFDFDALIPDLEKGFAAAAV